MIMCGPPGSGKTLLARSLPSILPPMTNEETLEVTKIYSVSGLLPSDTPMVRQRPFRSPHYTISNAGLVGGGHWPKPGEISLSHRGILFLDELPEFGHSLLEVLRQPLEDKRVTISRAQGRVTFPSNFMLVGAMNPCPCGFYGDPFRRCTCPAGLVSRYQRRISGPFIDRVDIFVEVPHIDYEKLTDKRLGEPSRVVQERVTAARQRQLRRFENTKLTSNSEMTPAEIREFCRVEDDAQSLLQAAMKQLYLSARAFPPHTQAGTVYRRPGGFRYHQGSARSRGGAVPAQKDRVMNGMTRAQCIVTRNGRILMARHHHEHDSWWCLPGGAVEPGETDAEAALRELSEECCVTGKIIRETGLFLEDNGNRSHTFLVDIGDQEPSLGYDPEVDNPILVDLKWLTLREISERDRAFLWAAGLLAIEEFFEEVSDWGANISYPE